MHVELKAERTGKPQYRMVLEMRDLSLMAQQNRILSKMTLSRAATMSSRSQFTQIWKQRKMPSLSHIELKAERKERTWNRNVPNLQRAS